ncbi:MULTISPECIES: DUF1700 domain-containing protein [Aerococcus]|uniref:DUF1700 domain-containing protein n=1 Tax=Aerococcus TaxID=1375 RepID=UPI000DCB7CCF|nr:MULTISPECIES: DUF1700 domain-containing protein [Aerococcus]KAA9219223.1 DUF1700 domain-containing protein [Aerococcus loyolae]KAA9266644.1 DUF1700 domain-containing protein [Aerococcus loyolae]MDK6231477.1 DUF1700 domain-containing protein [Aerococcus urinae]MDK6257991.1 DUF1700 domain-containing protein [Aerococcus urinae]MDK6293720.1 DUF1700 domain-containing protein [Aerococcus urinae]
MKKEEFFDLLRFYLHKLPQSVVNDILSDYQEHFQIAQNQGKAEEEICQELGSPKQIAKEYLENERVFIDERPQQAPSGHKTRRNLLLALLFIICLPFLIALFLGLGGTVFSLLVGFLAVIFTVFVIAITLLASLVNPQVFMSGPIQLGLMNELHPLTKIFVIIFCFCMVIILIYLVFRLIKGCWNMIKKAWYAIQWRRKRGDY